MIKAINKTETIVALNSKDLHPFEGHPFGVHDDEEMKNMIDSIKEFGILTPITVRPREEGGYEIISGHRRMRACELAGMDTIPAIVREVDRDTAIIMMVDSNLQRENILPSEKAKAYKMKLDALKRQGKRNDLTCAQVEHKLTSQKTVEKIAYDVGESRAQIQRYIRLNELSPPLQKLVDEEKMGLTPAVEISYLKPEEQALLVETIESEQATPSFSQAKRMRELSKLGKLNDDRMLDIMMEQKKPMSNNIVLPADKVNQYFPKSYTNEQKVTTIFRLLDVWQKHKQKSQTR